MVEEKPFRVLLDLSELNLNAPKYMWMNVSPRELHNIEDFKNAVLRKLNFERRDIKLFVHDGLLPEDEKIIILRENDKIKIQYDEPLSFNSSFRALNSSKVSIDENPSNESEVMETERKRTKKRKRKNEDADDAISEEAVIKSHKKKSKPSKSVSLEDHSSSMNGSAEIPMEIKSVDKEIISPIEPKEVENVFDIHQDTGCDVNAQEISQDTSGGSNCKKRKRRRHKKRKSKPEVMSLAPYDIVPEVETEDVSLAKTFIDNYGSIRKHIHFTSPTPNLYNSSVNSSNSNNKYLNTDSNCNGSSAEKTHVNSTPSSEACYEQDSWNVSPMPAVNEFSKVSDETVVYKKSATVKKKRQSFLDYPSLNCLPSEGAHIAFKTLELDESYCPVVTPYKDGIVKKVNSKTEELYIELLQEEVKPGKAGKFEILSEDEVPTEEVIKNVTLKWSSLLEPRCVTD